MKRFLSRNGIYFLVCGALGLRVAVMLLGLNLPAVRDEAVYERLARALLTDIFTYREIFRPPFYPTFLAFLFQISGAGRFGVEFAQALLECVNLALVFTLTRLIFKKQSVALLAAFLYALYPEAIALMRQYYSETLFNFLALLAFWVLLHFRGTAARLPIVGAGILLAVAALTRETIFYFALLVIPIWFLLGANQRTRGALFQIGALWFGMALVLMPWAFRNWNIEHRFVPISASGEYNLLKDNVKAQAQIECGKTSQRPDAGIVKCVPYFKIAQETFRNAPPSARTSLAIASTWQVISKYHLLWLNVKLEGLNLFWKPPTWQVYYFRVKPLARPLRPLFDWSVGTYHVIFLFATIVGFVAARNDSSKLLIALYLLCMFGIFTLTHFQARYREPLFTLFVPYAAYGLWQSAQFFRGRVSMRAALASPRVYVGALLAILISILILKNVWY